MNDSTCCCLDIPTYPNTTLTMMTQDRATHGVATPISPRNLNPTAPAFSHNQTAPTSPNNLNPTAPVFQQSPTGEKPPLDNIYSATDAGRLGLLTNGDISAGGTNYVLQLGVNGAGMLRETSPQSQLIQQLQGQGLQNSMPLGLALSPHTMLGTSTSMNHQSAMTAVTSHQLQTAYASVLDKMGGQLAQKQVQASSNQSSTHISNGDAYETSSNASAGGDDDSSKNAESGGNGGGQEYPEEVLAPIRKQMQFYFSTDNLPNDKFLNQHMDLEKFIPLELFLDFGRIKPICNSIDQLTKAVESSSFLELSEDRKRVRVSQCRKTLTLRGFPQYTTEQDVRQFILEMGAYVPTHIEFVMYKDNYSVWYVSFKDEAAALNSFFQFHNQKAVYKGHAIGCCIKSSGTLVTAGYYSSSEESNQRRLAYQNQVAAVTATAPVHAVQSPLPQPQPQQPQALMQPFSAMQLHPYLPGSPTNIYYQQTPQASYMPYMAGMIHGWPGATATMEPGLIMQNSGLQPQHIRSSMPRAHIMPPGSATQHRFNRPQRPRQNHLERSASERPSDRPPVVSVSMPARSSPHSESSATITAVSQGGYMPRRATIQEDIQQSNPAVIPQPQLVSHQFVPSLMTQHQQHAATTAATILNPSVLETLAVHPYQPPQHQLSHHNHQQQQHSVMVQAAMANTASAPPPPMPQITSNPPPSTQHMHHQHIQPPPPVQHQTAAQHHHQQQTTHPGQHNNQHHQLNQQPPPLQPHQHQLPQSNQHQLHQSQLNHHLNHQQPTQPNHQAPQSTHQHQAPQSSHQHQVSQSNHQHHPPQSNHQHHAPPSTHQHHAPQPTHQHSAPQSNHQHQAPQSNHQHQASQSNHQQRHHSPHQQHNIGSSYHQQQPHQYIPPYVFHHQHQQSPPGNRSEKRSRRKREDSGKNQRLERSQSNRSNYNSQTLTAADNFTMEANSFPPLPGAVNSITNSEISHESKFSDVARGVSRHPGPANLNIQRASSSTPSPVATPGPGSVSGLHHGLSGSGSLDTHSVDNGDLALDDDLNSSSQEEVDTDINTYDARSLRSEQPLSSAAESSVLPLHLTVRSQRGSNATPESSPASVLAQRQGDNHQSSVVAQAEGKGNHRTAYSHQQASPTAHIAMETPKLSYAQILTQKNPEDANNVSGGEILVSGGLLPNPNSGTSNGANLSQNINSSGPVGGIQTTNAFREHGNYQGGQNQGHHSSHRGQAKEGISRSEGASQSSRQPHNGSRRNSKENRTSNKFDRRKPDTRQK